MNETFGGLIRKRREEKELSQKDVANNIGVSTSYLSDIEGNRRGPGPDKMLDKLANALDLNRPTIYAWAGRLHPDIHAYVLEHPDSGWVLWRDFQGRFGIKERNNNG